MKDKPRSARRRVLRAIPEAFCVRLNDGTGYIIWPGKVQDRGFERPAIGYGVTARAAWASVEINAKAQGHKGPKGLK